MAKQHWFASLLTNSDGVWCGRFLRSTELALADEQELAAIHQWAANTGCAESRIFLPVSKGVGDWPPATPVASPGLLSLRLNQQRIDLNTAHQPGWSFAASVACYADIGWLLNRPLVPARAGGARNSPVQLIKLLADVERDADTRVLENAFRADPALSFQLLRLLNSAAFGLRTPVRSLGHAITLLGRRQLQRWLQLLIYAQPEKAGDTPNPLLQLAAYRGLLLEGLVRQTRGSEVEADAAYLTGIFSLLDRVIAQPLAQIVRQLPLDAHIAAALTSGDGPLGEWLALAVACDRGELPGATEILRRRGVAAEGWWLIQDAAYCWAYGLGKMTTVTA